MKRPGGHTPTQFVQLNLIRCVVIQKTSAVGGILLCKGLGVAGLGLDIWAAGLVSQSPPSFAFVIERHGFVSVKIGIFYNNVH